MQTYSPLSKFRRVIDFVHRLIRIYGCRGRRIHLNHITGRKIAGAADFNYSTGLKAKSGAWSAQSLDTYVTAPATFAPGTKMFARLADPAERAAVIAYLKTVK